MPIVVTCPSCSATLKAPDTAAGRRLKCPKCTSPIDVPAAAPPAVVQEEVVEDLPAGAIQEEPAPPMPAPRAEMAPSPGGYGGPAAPPPGQISRQTLGLVAILYPAGAFGIHKFIMGKTTPGLIMLLVALFGCGIGLIVMYAIALMEGVKYLRMSDAEFYETYVAGDKAWM